MMSCHLIPAWHKWNVDNDDVMMTWFVLFVNLGMSHLACLTHPCIHGTCALYKMVHLSRLVCMQANLNLERITTSQFWVLNAQNAIKNMPNMIPIAYLNENFMDCNENLAWGK